MKSPKWATVSADLAKGSLVPRKPGVYAFCQARRARGLIFEQRVVYVGKAKDLRRRFREHLNPMAEHNLELFKALQGATMEFWYTQTEDIDELEKMLIENITPEFNQRIG